MGGRTDGRNDGRTNESPPVFYRTLSPLGPQPCFSSLKFIIKQSRETSIADHILPLGDWLKFVLQWKIVIVFYAYLKKSRNHLLFFPSLYSSLHK